MFYIHFGSKEYEKEDIIMKKLVVLLLCSSLLLIGCGQNPSINNSDAGNNHVSEGDNSNTENTQEKDQFIIGKWIAVEQTGKNIEFRNDNTCIDIDVMLPGSQTECKYEYKEDLGIVTIYYSGYTQNYSVAEDNGIKKLVMNNITLVKENNFDLRQSYIEAASLEIKKDRSEISIGKEFVSQNDIKITINEMAYDSQQGLIIAKFHFENMNQETVEIFIEPYTYINSWQDQGYSIFHNFDISPKAFNLKGLSETDYNCNTRFGLFDLDKYREMDGKLSYIVTFDIICNRIVVEKVYIEVDELTGL